MKHIRLITKIKRQESLIDLMLEKLFNLFKLLYMGLYCLKKSTIIQFNYKKRCYSYQGLTFLAIIQNQKKQSAMSSTNQHTFIEGHILRRFNVLKKVGSGAYGHVWKVQQKFTKKIYALKKIFDAFQHATDAQRTYRQIEILRQLEHPNIIKLHETIKAENSRDVYLLFEFMQADLHNVIAENILKDVHIRFIIYQLAKALKYLHTGKIIHRDLKPSNILVNSNCTIKLCDFGLVRSLNQRKDQNVILTQGVATRWYRSPEVLLGSKSYSTPADIWSFGCIVYEILAQKPLFNGSCTLDQIQKICAFTGYPSEEDIVSLESEISRSMLKQMKISMNTKQNSLLKDFAPQYIDFLERILIFDPKKRISIEQILEHELVKTFRKAQEEISCNKEIVTSIDDNKKFSVDEYRKLVYGVNHSIQKPKALSSSLGAGLVSPKYQPPNQLNKTTVTFAANKPQSKSEIIKKYSFDRLKSSQVGYIQQTSKKINEKQSIKYIRSANNIPKYQFLVPQQAKEVKTSYDAFNMEEMDSQKCSNNQINQQNLYPNGRNLIKYPYYQRNIVQTNNYYQNSCSPMGSGNLTPGSANNSLHGSINFSNHQKNISWKPMPVSSPSIISPNEVKEKVLQFRSTKFISFQKPDPLQKTGFMQQGINKKCF